MESRAIFTVTLRATDKPDVICYTREFRPRGGQICLIGVRPDMDIVLPYSEYPDVYQEHCRLSPSPPQVLLINCGSPFPHICRVDGEPVLRDALIDCGTHLLELKQHRFLLTVTLQPEDDAPEPPVTHED